MMNNIEKKKKWWKLDGNWFLINISWFLLFGFSQDNETGVNKIKGYTIIANMFSTFRLSLAF